MGDGEGGGGGVKDGRVVRAEMASPQISLRDAAAPAEGEVSEFLPGPLDSISPDLPANPD